MRKAVFFLILFGIVSPVFADEVFLINGDRISGIIREVRATDLLILTDYGPYILLLAYIEEIHFQDSEEGIL